MRYFTIRSNILDTLDTCRAEPFSLSCYSPVTSYQSHSLHILHTIVQNGSGVVLSLRERGSGFRPSRTALQPKPFWTTPTLWSAVEHRLFRPCGQHNQTDNCPAPTLWSPVEQSRLTFNNISNNILDISPRPSDTDGTTTQAILDILDTCRAEHFRCSALALREMFRSPVRHGRRYNKPILDSHSDTLEYR